MLSPVIRRNVYVTQMSIQGIHQILGNILTRLPEPNRGNCNNLPVNAIENIVETTVASAICLRDSTSNATMSGIQSTRYQNGSFWTTSSFCVCRKTCKRRERRQWGPFIVENEMSFTDYHSPGCPLSTQQPLKQQTKRTLKFPIPFVESRWRNASHFSLFITAGTGGMDFGQSLAWVETVDRSQSPSFKIVEVAMDLQRLPTDNDRETLLLSCYRRLKWCFADKRASITDVDKSGRSIVDHVTCLISVCCLYVPNRTNIDLTAIRFSHRAKTALWMKLYGFFVCCPLLSIPLHIQNQEQGTSSSN